MKRSAGFEATERLVLAAVLMLAPNVAHSTTCGDVDDSGTIAATDALAVLKKAVGQDVGTLLCPVQLLSSGQTLSYGPGSDGDVRAGVPLAYSNNGDGTITDLNTGLMWEEKNWDRQSIHDVSQNSYTWGMITSPFTMNGTMVTDFLDVLNTPPCFAGYCDWRIPNVRELRSIASYENAFPAVDSAFNTNCVFGCTLATCSCTLASPYWSSSNYAGFAPFNDNAWSVDHGTGGGAVSNKGAIRPIRAVRGSSSCGDVDGNGAIAPTDALMLLKKAVGLQVGPLQCLPGLLASGETTAYGPGSDGDVRAGMPLRYRDNGDGTITDLNTDLTWEKKTSDQSIHDVANQYDWGMETAPYTMNGTMVTDFLAALNTPPCFSGHCDWRIPSIRELQSLVDYEFHDPAVDSAFNVGCVPGCSATACSCTGLVAYWSSTTDARSADKALTVESSTGATGARMKSSLISVRAVRGGT